jgi:hypothetical protein
MHSTRDPVIEASLSWKEINVEVLGQKALSSLLKEKALSIHGTGAIAATLTMREGEAGASHISGTIDISVLDAGYSSADETNIGEGIQGDLSGTYEIPLPADRVDFIFQSHIRDFELLSGKFYGNFKKKRLSLSGEGSCRQPLGECSFRGTEAALTGIGKIHVTGTVRVKDGPLFVDGEIGIAEVENQETFNFFLRDTYKERFPFLSAIEINGRTSAGFKVRGSPDRFALQGTVNITDMNVTGREKRPALHGIQLSLPVDLSYPQAGGSPRIKTYGFLRVQDASWEGITLSDIVLYPAVWNNALLFRENVMLKLFGGYIVLRDIVYSDLLSPERQFRFAAAVDNISLAEAGSAFDLPEFTGTLSGTIPKALFSQDRLSTEGEVVLELFDGKMTISDLSVQNAFSPAASIHSGIEIDGINLGKLTGTFDFGHISGILTGRIQDLVIVNGQAQRFRARLGTVEKKGVKQRISVEALKKISILGTGASTSLLDKGIYRFFKEYRYEKIGFNATLSNDTLLLLGLDSTGNMGYLVKGGLFPPKVDVINYNQNISFKEMVKRLQRIGQVQQ